MIREIRNECIYFINRVNFIQIIKTCILFDQIKFQFFLKNDYVFYVSLRVLYRRSFAKSHYHNKLHFRKNENF